MVNFKGLSVTKSLELFIEPALIFLCDRLLSGMCQISCSQPVENACYMASLQTFINGYNKIIKL